MLKLSLPHPPLRAATAHAVLVAIALLAAAALAWQGPIAQWPDYHAFADARNWLGMPNAANVLSNLPFAFVGGWALWRLSRLPREARLGGAHIAWCVFSAAVAATAFGSALYHWAPANGPLVFDRLPIAWACGALVCALLAERVDARCGSAAALAGALLAATLSVLAWWATERAGHGDLRAYLWVQGLPMLLVPAVLVLCLAPAGSRVTPASAWWTVLALYALAKLMEVADAGIFEVLRFTSGHTLKHLLAAAAAGWLLRAAINSGSRR
jgi:hypothetical protein